MHMNWYKTAAGVTYTLAKVVKDFVVTEKDGLEGRAYVPFSTRQDADNFPFKAGEYVGVYKKNEFWMMVKLNLDRGPSKFLVGILEAQAKECLKSEKGADGKPIQAANPNQLISILGAKNHYDPRNEEHTTVLFTVMDFAQKEVGKVLLAHKADRLLTQRELEAKHRESAALFDEGALRDYIVRYFNIFINNSWANKGQGAVGITGDLGRVVMELVKDVNEHLLWKAGKTKEQQFQKNVAEKAKAAGMVVCDRCGGKGGWEGWPGWTCYKCNGLGMIRPEDEGKL